MTNKPRIEYQNYLDWVAGLPPTQRIEETQHAQKTVNHIESLIYQHRREAISEAHAQNIDTNLNILPRAINKNLKPDRDLFLKALNTLLKSPISGRGMSHTELALRLIKQHEQTPTEKIPTKHLETITKAVARAKKVIDYPHH